MSAPVYGEVVDVMERFLVIFMSLQVVSQMSADIWEGAGVSWNPWIMGCGAVGSDAGR